MNIDFTLAGAVIFTGLVVVFVALVGLYAVVWAVGKLMVSLGVATPKKPTPPAPTTKAADPVASAPKQAAAPTIAPQQAAPAPQAVMAPIQTVPVPAYVEEGIGDEVVAVISAAVSAMFDGAGSSGQSEGGFVVRSIRRVRERTGWSQAGLAQNTQPF